MKKVISTILAIATSLSIAVTSFAEQTVNDVEITNDEVMFNGNTKADNVDGLALISEETYQLDDEWSVTVLGYSDAQSMNNQASVQSTGSGSDFYKYYCKFTRTAVGQSWDWLEMWVWGRFTWNTAADTVYVSDYDSTMNILHHHATIVSDTDTVKKDNQGMTFLFGHRYGIVTRTIVMHNGSGLNQTFTLSVDVNINGDVHTNPSNAIQV